MPVFLGAGRLDDLIPPRETSRLARLLESAGASVQLSWQPGGHRLTREEAQQARQWLSELNKRPGWKSGERSTAGMSNREVPYGA